MSAFIPCHGNLGGTTSLNYVPSIKGAWSDMKSGWELHNLWISFISSFCRLVGNGRSISFWNECWLVPIKLADNTRDFLVLKHTNKKCTLSGRILFTNNVVFWRWSWIRQIRTGREQDQLTCLQNDIFISHWQMVLMDGSGF